MEEIIANFHPRHFLLEYDPPIFASRVKGRCILCEKQVPFNYSYYYCRACDFYFHKECAITLMESNLTINHPKTHAHTLTFIRKLNSFDCDVCGMVNKYEVMNMYACLLCNFFVHKHCIYLPKVIKITRHSHRMLFSFQLSVGNMKCQVCTEKVVCGYGGYICIDKACDYKLHTYCATNSNVWDGKDVEREPEETNNYEDVVWPSLEEVDDKTFRHFSHDHDLMRLYINDDDEEGENGRVCQACILPIDFDSFLSCKECDFALHDACARLPQKMENAVHRHPLTLEINIEDGFFKCSTCHRESCGFMYRCCREQCGFKIDAKCATFAEPFYHELHEHPLSLFPGLNFNGEDNHCNYCLSSTRALTTCYKCKYYMVNLDFKCAFLPRMVKCKYDTHPLTLCKQPEKMSIWCDICEKESSHGIGLFYICYDCNTSVHVKCLIGKYPYLKPGRTIKVNGIEIHIASNRLSRPICFTCHGICQDKLVFISKRDGVCFCSMKCIRSSTKAGGNLTEIDVHAEEGSKHVSKKDLITLMDTLRDVKEQYELGKGGISMEWDLE